MRLNVFRPSRNSDFVLYDLLQSASPINMSFLATVKFNTTISGARYRRTQDNGLPWHNLGVLMERLGAIRTRDAYEKSTLVQPELKFYHYAYIEFLTSRTKDDAANIEKAFAFAEKNIGKTPYLTELRTEWQKP